ncbi:sodium:proton exchanger [Actinomadura rayongensis]|uniref:Sodium:proton exchanger n=1 Tax=Actinomadura rayongensis TaxID=1429076 RepID=A0A6I4WG82_9ACTN|nr:sodium:proton exchanger [Actinomadura rayongensis]MXQ66816.1 sodium:proton exchanger [Actinomadura rayongensis]
MEKRTAVTRVGLTVAAALPALVLRLTGTHPPPVVATLVYGLGVLAAAVVLMWASETARADISGALALALLALIAVLPEYAVDLYYAYAAGHRPEYTAYAAANMTGANRLLIGVGWAVVVLAFALATRRRGRGRHGRSSARRDVTLYPAHRIELGYLSLAAVVAFVPPLADEIGWYVSIPLLAIYVAYILRIARGGPDTAEEPMGVAAYFTALPAVPRRLATCGGFVFGAVIVFASAEPFAEALVHLGTSAGIDRFLLVQWLAPLASEAPELIVATVYAWRLRDADGIGALLSSKVNQWTLLIGTLPFAYRAGGGAWSLPLDARQAEEVLLTAAQTVLGLGFLIDLVFRRWEAAVLFVLFAIQFAIPSEQARLVLAGIYLAAGFTVLITKHRALAAAMSTALRPPASR